MGLQKYTSWYVNALLVIACIAALLIVPMLRSPSMSYPGSEAYFSLRMANSIGMEDSLSFGGRLAAYAWGLPWALSINPELLARILPFMLGILSFILFWLLLNDFGIDGVKEKRTALLILLASPTFIFVFSTLNSKMFPTLLTLLGFFLMLRKGRVKILALPVFAIMPVFSFPMSMIALFLLLLLTAYKARKSMWLYYTILGVTMFTASLYYGYFIRTEGFEMLKFEFEAGGINGHLQRIVSDFGGAFGIGIFAIMLACIGMLSGWARKYKDMFVFFSVFSLIILMLFREEAVVFINFFIAAFAARGISHLTAKRWESDTLKGFIILALACGLLFSAVSSMSRLAISMPDEITIKAMDKLSELPSGTVFSDYSRGVWINYAGQKNVMDENFRFAPDVNERWKDSEQLFSTRDWETAKGVMEKYGIRYIWIDSEMKSRIWKGEEEGLLFLLKYSPSMEQVYDADGSGIWEYAAEQSSYR